MLLYFGGCTSRSMCDRPGSYAYDENVIDIKALAHRMNAKQTLIFALTSAVAEGSGSSPQKETDPIRKHLLDTYSLSMASREEELHAMASFKTPRFIGLRFGTVVGLSPRQRTDLLHMTLVCQAYGSGRLRISHPESHRSFLALNDLIRAVHSVIISQHSDVVHERFNIFHLASFDSTVMSAANSISKATGARADFVSHSGNDSVGFTLATNKFRDSYNFRFHETQDSVINNLVAHAPRLCVGREITHRHHNESVPCAVCGTFSTSWTWACNHLPTIFTQT